MPDADVLGPAVARPRGALRILSRCEGREILILDGNERRPGADEREALLEWCDSTETAAGLARRCSELLGLVAAYEPNVDGWHPFSAEHLPRLVRQARRDLHTCVERRVPQKWTAERIARLAFLIGLGWTAQKIADDALIRSTANNVYRQAHRLGLSSTGGSRGQVSAMLPITVLAVYDRLAASSRITRALFVRRLLIRLAQDPARLAAIELEAR